MIRFQQLLKLSRAAKVAFKGRTAPCLSSGRGRIVTGVTAGVQVFCFHLRFVWGKVTRIFDRAIAKDAKIIDKLKNQKRYAQLGRLLWLV